MARNILKRDQNAPRFAGPTPAPKVGDTVQYIRPDLRPASQEGTEEDETKVEVPTAPDRVTPAKVAFMHPDLGGRVINLEVATAKGPELVLDVAFYPVAQMEEEEQIIGHSWDWPEEAPASRTKKTEET